MNYVRLTMSNGRTSSFELTDAETMELSSAILYGNGWWRQRDDDAALFLNLRYVQAVFVEEVPDERDD